MGTLENPVTRLLRRGRSNALALVCVLLMPQWAFAAYDVYVAPKFLYRGQDPTMIVVGPFFDTPEQAFAWVQSVVPPAMTLANLRPMPSYGGIYTITFNGIYFQLLSDQTVCNPNCSSTINQMVQTHVVCPSDMTPLQINYPEWANRQMVCWTSYPYADEPPQDCDSCVGNPIYVGTGLKVQRETDYLGPSGLSLDDPVSCLRDAFKQYPNPSDYFPLGKNSNTFAGTLFRSCCEGNLVLAMAWVAPLESTDGRQAGSDDEMDIRSSWLRRGWHNCC